MSFRNSKVTISFFFVCMCVCCCCCFVVVVFFVFFVVVVFGEGAGLWYIFYVYLPII